MRRRIARAHRKHVLRSGSFALRLVHLIFRLPCQLPGDALVGYNVLSSLDKIADHDRGSFLNFRQAFPEGQEILDCDDRSRIMLSLVPHVRELDPTCHHCCC